MSALRFFRPEDALGRESAEEILRAGGFEDGQDLDGRGQDRGGEGPEAEAETESWSQVNFGLGSKIVNVWSECICLQNIF